MGACARGRARGDGACVPSGSRRGRCAERVSRPSCIGACESMQAAWHTAAGAASTLRGRPRAEAAAGRQLPESLPSAMARRRDRGLERGQCTAGRRRSKRSSAPIHTLQRARARASACVGAPAWVVSWSLPSGAPVRALWRPPGRAGWEVDLPYGCPKEAPRRGRVDPPSRRDAPSAKTADTRRALRAPLLLLDLPTVRSIDRHA